ncbi:P-loop containing nucleoside triphosphate hydrolase protein [Radiomyces spectabilis]|uniref:P-loop containing nucleoside triphosphate hydrolase protein n=1 Tax=Radiomyces spectabilis TaxID=64574 RepID=UPI00222092A8|nr:P-loop containing nucleoside triphosphate hydrolase protein [Radiomyces spectabilis]KAI8393798.1 P-loop containing nucleoside triphosphate hydrolase protein [Radiomyces spectabilis]
MAPLEVIGAGFGRTGTQSLKEALNTLGYNTMHMTSFIADPTLDPTIFKDAYMDKDKPVDWDQAYKGFTAAVDWPTCLFYKELMAKYPNAKFILTMRDADSWYKSIKNTIHPRVRDVLAGGDHPEHLVRMVDMVATVELDGAHRDPALFANEDEMKRRFMKHNEEVQRTIPAERLLILQLGEGWDRLCRFLNKPVPKVPYPSSNSTEKFNASTERFLSQAAASSSA